MTIQFNSWRSHAVRGMTLLMIATLIMASLPIINPSTLDVAHAQEFCALDEQADCDLYDAVTAKAQAAVAFSVENMAMDMSIEAGEETITLNIDEMNGLINADPNAPEDIALDWTVGLMEIGLGSPSFGVEQETIEGVQMVLVDGLVYFYDPTTATWESESVGDMEPTTLDTTMTDLYSLSPTNEYWGGDLAIWNASTLSGDALAEAGFSDDRNIREINAQIRLGEVVAQPELQEQLATAIAQALATAGDDSLDAETIDFLLGGLFAQWRSDFNEGNVNYTYYIDADTQALVGLSFQMDIILDLAAFASLLGEDLGVDEIGVDLAFDMRLNYSDEPFDIQAPNTDETASTSPPSSEAAIQLDEPQFYAYAGIPIDPSLETNIVIEQAADVADGVVRGVLEDGTPFIGNPDAPFVLVEFGDFSCPHCMRFEPQMKTIINDFVRTGDLRVEWRSMTFVGAENSTRAAAGAYCAGQQGLFWEYHSEIFTILEVRGQNAYTVDRMQDLATDFGLDLEQFNDCVISSETAQYLINSDDLAQELEVRGTPSLYYREAESDTWISIPSSYEGVADILVPSTESS